jgi:hypothetical protein
MVVNRRRFLAQAAGFCALPWLGRVLPGCHDGAAEAASPLVGLEPPQRLTSALTQTSSGAWERAFSGVAAPQNLEVMDGSTGSRRRIHDMFPSANNPFGINTSAQLGAGGYGLSITDRAKVGAKPAPNEPMRPLCMVPFGVAIDGVLIDPSGPWFDGGPADPQNPFDRRCSGWEYDPIFATVAKLVGVPVEVRGHVQPGPGGQRGSRGQFHYHGVPRVMLANLRASLSDADKRDALVVGYAADGFTIIDAVVPAEATASRKRLHLFSGYVLRTGMRAALAHTNPALVPDGSYDGTYVQDWEHDPVKKRALIEDALAREGAYGGLSASDVASGKAEYALLDARNGLSSQGVRVPGVDAETYLYVITPDWPEVPRWFALEPSASFRNVIPFESPSASGPPGRKQLYDACTSSLTDVHRWDGRAPY